MDPNELATDIYPDWGSVFAGPHKWLKDASSDSLSEMLYRRKLLIFKKIKLDEQSFWGLGRRFGLPWKREQYQYSREKAIPVTLKDGNIAWVSAISNKISKRLGDREMPWHADIPNAVRYAFPHRAI